MNIPLPVICVVLGVILTTVVACFAWLGRRLTKIETDLVAIKTALQFSFGVEIKNAS